MILYDCGVCLEGRGWLTDEDGRVRPCHQCRPEQFERWRAGKWEPTHRGPRPDAVAAVRVAEVRDALGADQ